jgi:phosphoribosylformylglycinamidine (FGAM) synthase-like enzyme
MDFRRINFIRNANPDIDLPTSFGSKWTDNEEKQLLDEIARNIDTQIIAENHGRTLGGINSRIREIAYKMHISNFTIDKIIEATKLTKEQIDEIVERRERYKQEKKERNANNTNNSINKNSTEHILHIKQHNYDEDINKIKKQLNAIENKIDRLFDLLKTLEVV